MALDKEVAQDSRSSRGNPRHCPHGWSRILEPFSSSLVFLSKVDGRDHTEARPARIRSAFGVGPLPSKRRLLFPPVPADGPFFDLRTAPRGFALPAIVIFHL